MRDMSRVLKMKHLGSWVLGRSRTKSEAVAQGRMLSALGLTRFTYSPYIFNLDETNTARLYLCSLQIFGRYQGKVQLNPLLVVIA